jgi:hypothetical protein
MLLGAGPLVITEVMSNPAGGSGSGQPEDRNEFIEIYNPNDQSVDLLGWTISDGDGSDHVIAWEDSSIMADGDRLVINSTWLRPRGYAVILDSEYTMAQVSERPYRFGAGTLILTTGNTTLGNGLATTDPVVLISPYGDTTSTFGTPQDATDSIPCDPGDGISWERIDRLGPDTVSNWQTCLIPAGCTPGGPTSTSTFLDLAVEGLGLESPATPEPGQVVSCTVRVANKGAVGSDQWSLLVYLDRNGDGTASPDETIERVQGWFMPPGADSALAFQCQFPSVKTNLWAELVCPGDGDTLNDKQRVTLMPGGNQRLFDLELSSFTPDGDGFEDSVGIVFRLPGPGGTLTAAVFNLAGRHVREVYSGRLDKEQGILYWNGRRDNGVVSAAGVYAVWLEYEYRGSRYSGKLPVVLMKR